MHKREDTADCDLPRFLGVVILFISASTGLYTHTDAAGPIILVLDLRVAHERWASSSNPMPNSATKSIIPSLLT